MKRPKALHPVPKPKRKPKAQHHPGPHHAKPPPPPRSTGSAQHMTFSLHPGHKGGQHHKPAKPAHHAKPKRPKRKQPPRKLSPGSLVACCPAEAVAEVARLAGWLITAGDALDLYARCADGPSSGFTIAAALTAGLRGVPMEFAPFDLGEVMPLADAPASGRSGALVTRAGLILGVDLPGPHAVTVAPDGTWWSWGEPFDPDDWPDLIIEEAWAVLL